MSCHQRSGGNEGEESSHLQGRLHEIQLQDTCSGDQISYITEEIKHAGVTSGDWLTFNAGLFAREVEEMKVRNQLSARPSSLDPAAGHLTRRSN